MADVQTNGMIALVPSVEDCKRLAVDSGQDPDELHLTLAYLGDDVTDWTEDAVDALATLLYAAAPTFEPLTGHILGPAEFNPTGGPDGDKDPCTVYLIADAPDIIELRDWLISTLYRGDEYPSPPEQHEPFIPHVTVAWGGMPASELGADGPVTFDRVRLALGTHVTDIPLGADAVDEFDTDDDGSIELKWLPRVETKVASANPNAVRLRRYWARGAGRKKWNTFRSLRRQLAKYVKSERVLNGLTANIYHQAKGRWPGRRGGVQKKGLDEAWVDHSAPDAAEERMHAGVDDWGADFAADADDLDLTGFDDDDGDDGDPEFGPVGEVITADELDAARALGATAPVPVAAGVEVKARSGADIDAAAARFDAMLAADARGEQPVPDGGSDGPDLSSWRDVLNRDVQLEPLPGGELTARSTATGAAPMPERTTPPDITSLGSRGSTGRNRL